MIVVQWPTSVTWKQKRHDTQTKATTRKQKPGHKNKSHGTKSKATEQKKKTHGTKTKATAKKKIGTHSIIRFLSQRLILGLLIVILKNRV